MAVAQFNPSTMKAAFNPITGKALAIYKPCSLCPPKPTPERIRFTVEGLVYCAPFGSCCLDLVGARSKVMGEGIGWNGSMILTQGVTRCYWVGPGINDIFFYRWSENPCRWSAYELGDFGQIHVSSEDNCSGGVAEIRNIIGKEYFIQISDHNWYINVHLLVQLSSGYIEYWHIFYATYSEGYPWEYCVPYGEVIDNEYACPRPDNLCIGDGTVVLTEVS